MTEIHYPAWLTQAIRSLRCEEEYIGEIYCIYILKEEKEKDREEEKRERQRKKERERRGEGTKESEIERAGAKREERDMITFSVSVVLGVAQHEC